MRVCVNLLYFSHSYRKNFEIRFIADKSNTVRQCGDFELPAN